MDKKRLDILNLLLYTIIINLLFIYMKNTILTYEQAEKRRLEFYSYGNEAYEYKTKEDGYWHLIIGGKDVLDGKNAVVCHYHGNGVYSYRTEDGYLHLIINGKDVFKGKRVVNCWYWDNGGYRYIEEGSKYWKLIINRKDVLEGKEAVECYYHGEGIYEYKNKDGNVYRITRNAKGGFTYKKNLK